MEFSFPVFHHFVRKHPEKRFIFVKNFYHWINELSQFPNCEFVLSVNDLLKGE